MYKIFARLNRNIFFIVKILRTDLKNNEFVLLLIYCRHTIRKCIHKQSIFIKSEQITLKYYVKYNRREVNVFIYLSSLFKLVTYWSQCYVIHVSYFQLQLWYYWLDFIYIPLLSRYTILGAVLIKFWHNTYRTIKI